MAGDGKNTDDITIPMLFLFSKEGTIILDAIREYQEVEVLLSDKAKDRGNIILPCSHDAFTISFVIYVPYG